MTIKFKIEKIYVTGREQDVDKYVDTTASIAITDEVLQNSQLMMLDNSTSIMINTDYIDANNMLVNYDIFLFIKDNKICCLLYQGWESEDKPMIIIDIKWEKNELADIYHYICV